MLLLRRSGRRESQAVVGAESGRDALLLVDTVRGSSCLLLLGVGAGLLLVLDADATAGEIGALEVHHRDLGLGLRRETEEESVSEDAALVAEKAEVGRDHGSRNTLQLLRLFAGAAGIFGRC